ncbi:MAG: type VI secretion system ATPase TssH, partial [Chloroflexi bacterium]|nr:type VI secretion system ATPase TssH [Chloroflexota bacterium]
MSLDLNRYTQKAQEAILAAQDSAERRNHSQVEVEHLLLALLQQRDGVVPQILAKMGLAQDRVERDVEAALERLPKAYGPVQVYVSQNLAAALRTAADEAARMHDEFISTEHLLLGCLAARGRAGEILRQYGVTPERIYQALTSIRGSQRVTDQNPEGRYQALEKYARDITDLARKGKLDPVIGREEEIRRVIQVLSRRTKNNPVLVGEAGVGKTAIVEGLAQRIV